MRPVGYCVPNPTTYPWQWLWDSCFHAVVWAHLGDERADARARAARSSAQDGDGLRPPPPLRRRPQPHAALWGRSGASTITQPPMYGHAVAELTAARVRGGRATSSTARRAGCGSCSAGGGAPRAAWWSSAIRGSRVATTARAGTTSSPRGGAPGRGSTGRARWWARSSGRPAGRRSTTRRSPSARPASPPWWHGTRWSWRASRPTTTCADRRSELADAVDARWDAERTTWVDDGPTADGSGGVRTLDALLPLLLRPRPEAIASLTDPTAFGARLRAPRRPSRRALLRRRPPTGVAPPGPSSPTCSGWPPARCTTARPRPPCRGRWSPGP